MPAQAQPSHYQQKIQIVAEYIRANLEGHLSLDELARVCGISKHHFHRIFSAVTGRPLGEYIQTERLLAAFQKLKARRPQQSVIDIALAVGYESHSAFSRAFTKYFGFAPSAVTPHTRTEFKIRRAPAQPKPGIQPVRRVKLDQWSVLGGSGAGYQGFTYVEACYAVEERIRAALAPRRVNYATDQVIFLQLNDIINDAHAHCAFFLGLGALDITPHQPLDRYTFPAGEWAAFEHVGPYSTMWQTWSKIFCEWIVPNGVVLGERQAFTHAIGDPNLVPHAEMLSHMYFPVG